MNRQVAVILLASGNRLLTASSVDHDTIEDVFYHGVTPSWMEAVTPLLSPKPMSEDDDDVEDGGNENVRRNNMGIRRTSDEHSDAATGMYANMMCISSV